MGVIVGIAAAVGEGVFVKVAVPVGNRVGDEPEVGETVGVGITPGDGVERLVGVG